VALRAVIAPRGYQLPRAAAVREAAP